MWPRILPVTSNRRRKGADRVYLYWFERSGTQRVDWEAHASSSSRGLHSLLHPAECYGRGCGYPKSAEDMAKLQSLFNADDSTVEDKDEGTEFGRKDVGKWLRERR
jgi:hypothetical protein